MSFTPLPMDVDRPVLWLVALLAIVAVGVGLGVGWSEAQVSLVEIRVGDDGAGEAVTATLERSEDGQFRRVERATLNANGSDEGPVRWTTRDAGWYRLRLAGPDRTCEVRISVQASDDGLTGRMLAASDGPCPNVALRVDEVRRPFWQAGDA